MNIINKIYKRLGIGAVAAVILASCSPDSSLVEFVDDNTLNHETDSVYSVMGIIHGMQTIADRTVLLGDIRSDLTSTTNYANADLKKLANFEVDEKNRYNQISDYYAIINNCNYFLSRADVNLEKRGYKVFEREYAAVKTFRAWTYLQAALVYGKVPLITNPLLSENAAAEAAKKEPSDIETICNYFIDDLKPYVDVRVPDYGTVGGSSSTNFFIPMRLLLGDLCLWAGRYLEAADYYHQYLTHEDKAWTSYNDYASWGNRNKWDDIQNWDWAFSGIYDPLELEFMSYIPMETSEYQGTMSDLSNIYTSTQYNNYYVQATPSAALRKLSSSQYFCVEHIDETKGVPDDTIYAPHDIIPELYAGDLRLPSWYTTSKANVTINSPYSADRQRIDKFSSQQSRVVLYRTTMVYLRFAEALNLAGFPQTAFAILKYGLHNEKTSTAPEGNIKKYIDATERAEIDATHRNLLVFDSRFTDGRTLGIHARGCGDARCDDEKYAMPMPPSPLPTRRDTVLYQQPFVEELIMTEYALDGMFEGNRYYDLMRVALRHNDPAYLADRVANRDGSLNAALRQKLMNKDNWYLKKP